MEKSTGKIIKIIYRTFLIIMGACLLSLLITRLATGKSTIFGIKPIFVATESMEPVIHAKSMVLALPVDAEDLAVGDIAVYRSNDAVPLMIVHRVIGIEGSSYIFKGDNNNVADDPVSADQILYKVTVI